MDRGAARRALVVYFVGVIVGSGLVEALILRAGGAIASHPALVVALMWTPALASLVARLATRQGPRDVSFRLRGSGCAARALATAWLAPLVIAGVAYALAWSLGLDAFAPPRMAKLGLEHAAAPVKFAVSLGLNLTLGTIFSALTAAGEEIGWRGFMLTRLVDAGAPRPVLTSALIWGAWHTPLILSGQYASGPHPALSALLFVIGIVGGGFIAGRVRLESGSVWPAVVFHSSWNALIQGTFDGFTRGGDASHTTNVWTGESGVLVAVTSLVVGAALVARPLSMRRFPRDAPSRVSW